MSVRQAASGRWLAQIGIRYRSVFLGSFATEDEARVAYETARASNPSHLSFASEEARFRAKVAVTATCHTWTASTNGRGYGHFKLKRQRGFVYAHRYAFFLANGRWPIGNILHSCDNPSCVNPEHLSEGTQSENVRQSFERARRPDARMTVVTVREARDRHAAGETIAAIARDMGIAPNTVGNAVNRQTWSWVDSGHGGER